MKDFEDLVRTVVTLCNPEEQERLREMEDWIVKNEVRLFQNHKTTTSKGQKSSAGRYEICQNLGAGHLGSCRGIQLIPGQCASLRGLAK